MDKPKNASSVIFTARTDVKHDLRARIFPDTFSTAVRQKSRWIIGIVFQGFKTHKWTSSLTLNYFLWRDRKGAISNFVSFLAMLVMIQLLLLLAYESLWPDA